MRHSMDADVSFFRESWKTKTKVQQNKNNKKIYRKTTTTKNEQKYEEAKTPLATIPVGFLQQIRQSHNWRSGLKKIRPRRSHPGAAKYMFFTTHLAISIPRWLFLGCISENDPKKPKTTEQPEIKATRTLHPRTSTWVLERSATIYK